MKNKLLHSFLSIQENKSIVFYVVVEFDDYLYHHEREINGSVELITLSEEKAYNLRKVYSADLTNPDYWERDTSAWSRLPYKIEISIDDNDKISINCDSLIHDLGVLPLIPFNDPEFINKYTFSFINDKRQLKYIADTSNIKYIYLDSYDKNLMDILTNLLSKNEKNNIIELQITDNYLTNIELLIHFENIQYLDLQYNNIKNIPHFKGNKNNLKYLDLSHNNINDITPLKDLHNLEYLDLSYNKIEDITALKNLQNLKYLNLSKNKINNIGYSINQPNLNHLDLSFNMITDISGLKSASSLKYLNTSDNKIFDIDVLSSLNNLKFLILNYNNIDFVESLNNIPNLIHLEIINNEIEYTRNFGRTGLNNLKILKMDHNFLTKIPDLSNCNNLQYCSFTHNFISNRIILPKSIRIVDYFKKIYPENSLKLIYKTNDFLPMLKEKMKYTYKDETSETGIIYLK